MILFSKARAVNVPKKTYTQFLVEGFVIDVFKKPRINEYIYSSCNVILFSKYNKKSMTPEELETEFIARCTKHKIDKNTLINFIRESLDEYITNIRKVTEEVILAYSEF